MKIFIAALFKKTTLNTDVEEKEEDTEDIYKRLKYLEGSPLTCYLNSIDRTILNSIIYLTIKHDDLTLFKKLFDNNRIENNESIDSVILNNSENIFKFLIESDVIDNRKDKLLDKMYEFRNFKFLCVLLHKKQYNINKAKFLKYFAENNYYEEVKLLTNFYEFDEAELLILKKVYKKKIYELLKHKKVNKKM